MMSKIPSVSINVAGKGINYYTEISKEKKNICLKGDVINWGEYLTSFTVLNECGSFYRDICIYMQE